ncbi:MAG TPA: GAF domain-containing protein [Pyrinomonadaceae bacterium]|nr:GAF domain-containing protein [Chloracidobacterium sp.]MBP9937037.1 GAF domain-containing protein [Pyrinomonadaceae bacterium]MBK9439258.1 GAF domain-containing protein [Chloracidobacterium sp.]MBL0239450.1 GAF domain-containing protein [Chloracidobacterium sp.]HQY68425.1 GAF domain-containing protein [Pyrinomonadaceae bacterium]
MSELDDRGLSAKLQQLIETIDIARLMSEPFTSSINELLVSSAASMNSDEASVLVREGSGGDLRFLAAIGRVADRLIGMTVPSGKGIAGFVLSSGQPMAITDVGDDNTFYAEVDRATGFSTQTILATPLRYGGEVIGVLEYINRKGDPPFNPFTPDEMDRAAIYADAIAAMVNAYHSARLFSDLSDKVLSNDGVMDFSSVRKWVAELRDAGESRERLDLSVLVREVASLGDAERKLCRELLETILRYSDTKASTSFMNY